MDTGIIFKYFPDLTDKQRSQFEALGNIYAEWNDKINVISRKDIDNLYLHHVLHSLSIARFVQFKPESQILDIGTGGGFPGVPLAILFPRVEFRLVDSINKKLTVIDAVKKEIGLRNVITEHKRAEKVAGHFDFAVTRAVANLSTLNNWTQGKFKKKHDHYPILNGLIALKGGDLKEELAPFKDKAQQIPITEYFDEPYFAEKYLIYLPNKAREKDISKLIK